MKQVKDRKFNKNKMNNNLEILYVFSYLQKKRIRTHKQSCRIFLFWNKIKIIQFFLQVVL